MPHAGLLQSEWQPLPYYEFVSFVSSQTLRDAARYLSLQPFITVCPLPHLCAACPDSCCTGPKRLQEVVSMAVEILEGLVQLHAISIWHFNLKPANILLDEHQHAYLADFGISYVLQTLQSCTALTSCVGTPHYL